MRVKRLSLICFFLGSMTFAADKKAPLHRPLTDESIFKLLAPYQKKKSPERFAFFDINCSNRKGQSDCQMSAQPDGKPIHLKPADSESLFLDILARLPVAQGETGASTEFISCSRWKEDKLDQYQCRIAIPVQRVPHDWSSPD